MPSLVLRVLDEPVTAGCALCGEVAELGAGPQLYQSEPPAPVCEGCGAAHDPPLAALVELARLAERVGRIGRHNPTVPLTALLQLAAQAERYAAHFLEAKRPAV